MDWEDDDEKTTVYDTVEEEANALPRPAAGTPMPPAAYASAPPPSMPRPSFVTPPSAQPAYRAPLTVPPVAHTQPSPAAQGSSGKRSAVMGVGIAAGVVVAAAAAWFAFVPSTHKLLVQLAGTDGGDVKGTTMLVDGEPAICHDTVCEFHAKAGPHTLTITAPKYKDLTHAIQVEAGGALQNLELTPVSAGTGFRIASTSKGLTLFVNGKEIGALPQEMKNLPPGEHDVKIVGGKSFEDWTQKVKVSADTVADLGSVKLKVKQGQATIRLGTNAEGAKVIIDCGEPKALKPNEFGVPINNVPSTGCKIIGQRTGFAEVVQDVSFEPGEPSREFTIDFAAKEEVQKPPPRVKAQPRPRPRPRPTPVAPKDPPKATGTGTLNINSIPPSAVILDGKPLGKTPQLGLKVEPGQHTVVFIHREYGKRVKKINITEGSRKVTIVNFKKDKD